MKVQLWNIIQEPLYAQHKTQNNKNIVLKAIVPKEQLLNKYESCINVPWEFEESQFGKYEEVKVFPS